MQVSDNWDAIWFSIKEALPEQLHGNENEVLKHILNNDLWVYLAVINGITLGIITLTATYDFVTETKNLLIFSIYGIRPLSVDEWLLGLKEVRKIAKANGCYKIVAQTSNDKIKEIVKSLGGDTSLTLISLEV